MWCRYCGQGSLTFKGLDDGGGDFGDSIVELWECEDCGEITETIGSDAVYGDDDDETETERPSPPVLTDDDIADIPF